MHSQSVFVPQTNPYMLPPDDFNAFLSQIGQRVAWMRSHSCPCVWTQSGALNGRLSTAGSPQKGCRTCLGLGIYWDSPGLPFAAGMSFRHLSPSPDEPGVMTEERLGLAQLSEPALTIPYVNPFLDPGDPRQPTGVWCSGSVNDIFCAVDMLARYNAVLQLGAQENLPLQQNLTVAPSGAVFLWDPASASVYASDDYVVSGATVTLGNQPLRDSAGNIVYDSAGNPIVGSNPFPLGTSYMVEFQASALFVAFRRAGGLPHVRPFGGGQVNLPRAFRVQALDFWTRQRGLQPTISVGGVVLASQVV